MAGNSTFLSPGFLVSVETVILACLPEFFESEKDVPVIH